MVGDRLPRALEIRARLGGIVARYDEGTDAREAFEYREGRGVQDDWLAAGFAIPQEQHATLEIHIAPLKVQNFAKPTAREQQEPERGGGARMQLGPPPFG